MTNADSPDNPFEDSPRPTEEADQIEQLAKITTQLQDMRYKGSRKILRGVHPKSHGCLRAVFQVLPDLDESLQVGLFATPGRRYRAKIRFSNASVRVEPDITESGHGSRGMALKVLNVDGEMLLDDEGKNNQDFLMINQPAFAFANAEDYLRLNQISLANDDKIDAFFAPFPGITPQQGARLQRSGQLVKELLTTPVANPLTVKYFGAAPFLFGPDRVMRFSAEPKVGETHQVLPEAPSENYLREALEETMGGSDDVVFDFKVQVRGAGDDLAIENASAVWDEAETPYVTVAKIMIPAPQRNLFSRHRRRACERLVFTPWHSLADHRPLGSINRLRKAVYLASEEHRKPMRARRRRGTVKRPRPNAP
ncbi:MAG: catalase family protein [Pseudomonadota bacterium]